MKTHIISFNQADRESMTLVSDSDGMGFNFIVERLGSTHIIHISKREALTLYEAIKEEIGRW